MQRGDALGRFHGYPPYMGCRGLIFASLALGACSGERYPVTERLTVVNDRSVNVYVLARCGAPEFELRRGATPGGERINFRRSYCGTCACDLACGCPPCEPCGRPPLVLAPGGKAEILWSGEQFSRDQDPSCGAACLRGELVSPGWYRLQICYSLYLFGHADPDRRDRRFPCVTRVFDPSTEKEVALHIDGTECRGDDDCGPQEVCNIELPADSAALPRIGGEALCRKRCAFGCGPSEECRAAFIRQGQATHSEELCFPR